MALRLRDLLLSAAVSAAPASLAWGQGLTACARGDVLCLDQGWTEAQRSMWYTTSQGSRLLPLSWARALRTADGQAFFGTPHLQGLGYLANPRSRDNPEGLPVGFAVDQGRTAEANLMCDRFPETCRAGTMREPWVGLTCAACHTAEITHAGTRIRIDGGPAMADFDALVNGIEDRLRATRDDPARLAQFAAEVDSLPAPDSRLAALARQMDEQIAWMAELRAHNDGAVEAGPGRLDAQGHILTKVALVNGAEGQPTDFKADAPASYPFIWNTHQQSQLQWNGIAGGVVKLRIFWRNTDIGALIRNSAEVIGVFAHIEADSGRTWHRSSLRIMELVSLERVLEQLQSPAWPQDVLGPLDADRVNRGAALFEAKCQECHSPLARGDQSSRARIAMTPLAESGTDVFLACNTFLRTAKAGGMAGQRTLGLAGEQIGEVDAVHKMLVNAATGAILRNWDTLVESIFRDMVPPPLEIPQVMAALPGPVLADVKDPVKRERAAACLRAGPGVSLLAYKARPLNGIWATAPYLHNGSVPTLHDLLLPAAARNVASPLDEPPPEGPLRPERFDLGTREFDPVKVGYAAEEPGNDWTFRVRDDEGSIIPGNSNAGHDYGNASLSEEDRLDLIEYLKSL